MVKEVAMNWKTIADETYPLVLPLLITAVAWYAQGWSLLKPKEKKEIGESLVNGAKWLGIAAGAIFFLGFVFDQLAIWRVGT
jgi:hypothetical protein